MLDKKTLTQRHIKMLQILKNKERRALNVGDCEELVDMELLEKISESPPIYILTTKGEDLLSSKKNS